MNWPPPDAEGRPAAVPAARSVTLRRRRNVGKSPSPVKADGSFLYTSARDQRYRRPYVPARGRVDARGTVAIVLR
jgi:hypothetical protein